MKKLFLFSPLILLLLCKSCKSEESKISENAVLSESIETTIATYWECIEAYTPTNVEAPLVDFNLSGEQPVINGNIYEKWEIRGAKLMIEIAQRSDASFSIIEMDKDMIKIKSDVSGNIYLLNRRVI